MVLLVYVEQDLVAASHVVTAARVDAPVRVSGARVDSERVADIAAFHHAFRFRFGAVARDLFGRRGSGTVIAVRVRVRVPARVTARVPVLVGVFRVQPDMEVGRVPLFAAVVAVWQTELADDLGVQSFLDIVKDQTCASERMLFKFTGYQIRQC